MYFQLNNTFKDIYASQHQTRNKQSLFQVI